MGGGSKGGSQSQTVKRSPWGPSQDYLKEIMGQAQANYQSGGPQYYPDSTVTPELGSSSTALQGIMNRGMAGSPVNTAAQNNELGVLNGDYLDPTNNPGFQSVLNSTIANTLPSIQSQFSLAGRTGSGMNQQAVAQGLGNAIGGLEYSNYNNERSNQMQALGLAPQIANQDYIDLGNALGASQQQETYNQQQLNDQVARWNQQQNAPNANLNQYASIVDPIGGMGGTESSTSSGGGKGKGAGLLGTALVGSNIASQAFGPGFLLGTGGANNVLNSLGAMGSGPFS